MTGRAREIIGEAYSDMELNAISADDAVSAILARLTAAGYRLLAPGDLDKVTLERCAEVADQAEQPGIPGSSEWITQGNFAGAIAAAIRSLGTHALPFTPTTLAERWQCSERHVYNMIERGELPSFRLGGKLLRIRAEDVEAIECQAGGSQGSTANTASPGTTTPGSAAVIDLEHQMQKRRPAAPRLDTPSLRARSERR